jgi:hypothetical protein
LAAATCFRRIRRAIASLLSLLLPGFRFASSGPRAASSSIAAGLSPQPWVRGIGPSDNLEEQKMTTTNKPVHEIKQGRIRAAIWANESQSGTRHTVSLERLYKQEGSWKRATSFYADDVPNLTKVLTEAQGWISSQATAPVAEEVA